MVVREEISEVGSNAESNIIDKLPLLALPHSPHQHPHHCHYHHCHRHHHLVNAISAIIFVIDINTMFVSLTRMTQYSAVSQNSQLPSTGTPSSLSLVIIVMIIISHHLHLSS